MKLSCHLITWGREWRHGMEEAAGLGFKACETFTHVAMEYEQKVDEFKELLDSHGLRLSALYGGGTFADPAKRDGLIDFNARVAKFIAACGGDRIVFGPGLPRNPAGTSPEELRQIASTIDEAAKHCAEVGVTACVHPHLWTEIQDENELVAVMELTDPETVKLCIDTAHTSVAGMDPAALVRTYGERLGYLHLKDVVVGTEGVPTLEMMRATDAIPIFNELGQGTVDLPGVLTALNEISYDGWLCVEIDVSTTTPLNSLTICRDYVVDQLGLSLEVVA